MEESDLTGVKKLGKEVRRFEKLMGARAVIKKQMRLFEMDKRNGL